ncbi:LysM peptidoglycan-binding domain-containing protein, partial [Verrucomicrobiota bacterium]
YIVKKGDCLSVIASSHGTTVQAIKKSNSLVSDTIRVGQKLIISGASVGETPKPDKLDLELPEVDLDSGLMEDVPAPSLPEPEKDSTKWYKKPSAKPVSTRKHIVEKDDDLLKVAQIWMISVEELKEFNNLTDTSLEPGQVLLIPMME